MRAEYQRCASPSTASSSARPATVAASATTTPCLCGMMPRSMMPFSSSGLATTITAPSALSARNSTRSRT